ncbi:hypothetical protein EC973_009292 [Apophysomyces ossiformis]|uniref:Uncharacterized protein n=1 Tax=Apophysomyces ossiformis TaxID=679940 RepID=A0A8H7ESK2_9FUNG|nr:hypothetical protein EC973_009292 [Apophysomyces ossiformis]
MTLWLEWSDPPTDCGMMTIELATQSGDSLYNPRVLENTIQANRDTKNIIANIPNVTPGNNYWVVATCSGSSSRANYGPMTIHPLFGDWVPGPVPSSTASNPTGPTGTPQPTGPIGSPLPKSPVDPYPTSYPSITSRPDDDDNYYWPRNPTNPAQPKGLALPIPVIVVISVGGLLVTLASAYFIRRFCCMQDYGRKQASNVLYEDRPYFSQGSPYISKDRPYISQDRPYSSHNDVESTSPMNTVHHPEQSQTPYTNHHAAVSVPSPVALNTTPTSHTYPYEWQTYGANHAPNFSESGYKYSVEPLTHTKTLVQQPANIPSYKPDTPTNIIKPDHDLTIHIDKPHSRSRPQ